MIAAIALGMWLIGCHHQPTIPALPAAAQTPGVFIIEPQVPPPPVMQAALPQALFQTEPEVVVEAKPHRHLRRTSPTSRGIPIEESTVSDLPSIATADTALGDLSPGDSSATQNRAAKEITRVERRLKALSSDVQHRRSHDIAQVRHFLNQASGALQMGDAEGAQNLANKAGLLLDDIQQ